MAGLVSKKIKDSYKSLIRVDDDSNGLDGSLANITDGAGNTGPFQMSRTAVEFTSGTSLTLGASTALNTRQVNAASGTLGLSIDFSPSDTGLSKIILGNNLEDALNIAESTNSYLKFVTTTGSEKIVLGKDVEIAGDLTAATITGDVNFDSNTLFIDESENRVGIGTNSPGNVLHLEFNDDSDVFTAARITDNSVSGILINNLDTGNGHGGMLKFANKNGDNHTAIVHSQDGNTDASLLFYSMDGGTLAEVMRVDHTHRVGIGTAAPSYKFTVKSGGEGSIANSGIVIENNDDTNIALALFEENTSPTTGMIRVYSGGSEKVQINGNGDSYFTGGEVGIGTTSPAHLLDIKNSSGGASARIEAGANSSASLRLQNDAQDWDVNCQTTDNFAIYDQTGGASALTIAPSNYNATFNGDVIVDNTSSTHNLYLKGTNGYPNEIGANHDGVRKGVLRTTETVTINGNICYTSDYFTQGNKATGFGSAIRFFTSSGNADATEKMVISHEGNIGINTTSPQSKFVVSNAGEGGMEFRPSNSTNIISVFNRNTSSYPALQFEASYFNFTPQGGGLIIDSDINDPKHFELRSTGDVAHGMTGLENTATFFRVNKLNNDTGGAQIAGYSENNLGIEIVPRVTNEISLVSPATNDSAPFQVVVAKKSSDSVQALDASKSLVAFKNHTNTRFIFDSDGRGYANNTFTTFSDSRLKKDVVEIPYGLETVNKLKPKKYVRYSGKIENDNVVLEENGWDEIGFLAQDVKEIIPELISNPNCDESKGFYAMDDGKMTSILVKAIQELSAKVTELEKKLGE